MSLVKELHLMIELFQSIQVTERTKIAKTVGVNLKTLDLSSDTLNQQQLGKMLMTDVIVLEHF